MNQGDYIRKTLATVDFALVSAKTEYRLASKTEKFYSKFDNEQAKVKSIEARIKKEAYKVYIKELATIKEQALLDLENCLKRYSELEQQVWRLHFLKQSTNAMIADELKIDIKKVYAIVKKIEEDITQGE